MKKEIPLAIGFTMGLSIVLAMFLKGVSWLVAWKVILDDWFQIVTAWAVGLGVVNLTQIHGRAVSQKREGWAKSGFLIACMFGMTVFGFFFVKSTNDTSWAWNYKNVIAPMNATVFSTFGLYTASAAYRTFRFRNAEAAVLMIAAVIVMLGSVPVGRLMFGPGITTVRDWLQNVPTAAGMRGLQLGAVLGGMVTALRMMLGIERGYLGGE